MDEYENDKWRLIAAKVGSGFSPVACQEKAEELEIQEDSDEDEASSDSQPPRSDPRTTTTQQQQQQQHYPAGSIGS